MRRRQGKARRFAPCYAASGDSQALLFGSYHRNDFGLFYAAIRQNAVGRAAAFTAAKGSP